MTKTEQSSTTSAQIAEILKLGVGLGKAAKAFDPSAPDGGRLGIFVALRAMHDFLSATFDGDPSAFIAVNPLIYALADLERGKVVPLLSPQKVKNRPRDSVAEEAFRASVAVPMDLFMQSGVARKQAAHDVAKALSRMGYRDGRGKPIKPHMVEDWRDRMMTERPAENLAAERFHRLREALLAEFPSNPSEAAKSALERLPLVVRPGNPKNPPA